MQTLDWLDVETMLGYGGKRSGPPERSRLALAQAFIAKAVLRLGQTKQLRERLLADTAIRRLLGFDSSYKLPSEAAFSRTFKEYAKTNLPARVHEVLRRAHLAKSSLITSPEMPPPSMPGSASSSSPSRLRWCVLGATGPKTAHLLLHPYPAAVFRHSYCKRRCKP